jgi:site-specific recombinase
MDSQAHTALAARLDELGDGSTAGVEWLASLVRTVRPATAAEAPVAIASLCELLAARPEASCAFAACLDRLVGSRLHRIAYANLEPLRGGGIAGNVAARAFGRLLPRRVGPVFLSDLLEEVFDHGDDYRWLEAVTAADWERLYGVLDLGGGRAATLRVRCRAELFEALRLVAARAAALGSDPALLRYLPELARHESAFLQLSNAVERWHEAEGHGEARDGQDAAHVEVLLAQCRDVAGRVRRRSQEAGVDVNMVVQLARLERALARLGLLSALTGGGHAAAIGFFVGLVRQENRRNSIRDWCADALQLLARRVTEHASRSGEHYMSENRAELVAMFRAAAGAGYVIAVMALFKVFLGRLHLPPLWEAVAFSLNYGLGFVLIHALHLTIATKQPAMTAATIAASIDGVGERRARVAALVEVAARVSRTQWVSIAGNVTVGFATALSITLVANRLLGVHPVGAAKAAHLIEDLHPWQSPALFYAAIAGVYLYLSGLISGYYDNVCLYHGVPERLRRARWLRRILGEARLARFSRYVERELGAIAGNFLFGCMLGSTPLLGTLIGLPLDIRHVAFASANLGYGLGALDFTVAPATVAVSVLGVLLVGLVNLTVSFQLALRTALRSRGIGPDDVEGLGAAVFERLWRRPLDFFWSPAAGR